MDSDTIFFIIFILWYLKIYHSSHPAIIHFCKTTDDWLKYCNYLIAPEYFSYDDDNTSDKTEPTPIVKYEDKYLLDIQKMDREFNFDDNQEFNSKIEELLNAKNESNQKRNEEIKLLLTQFDLNIQIDNDSDNSEDGFSIIPEQPISDKIKKLTDDTRNLLLEESKSLNLYLDIIDGPAYCMKQAKEAAFQFFIEHKLKSLCNCSVLEHTPNGNVLMMYDNEYGKFKYYSDNSIPYRYLEVVARKYVKQFNCRSIFVDMAEELQLSENKKEQEKKEQEKKEQEKKEQEKKEHDEMGEKANTHHIQEKKSVFAKFKNYNKDTSSGHINTGAPPKNSLPNKQIADKSEADYVLKNNANRYIYEGKMANFNFLKKVDKKTVDKKSAMTFANFKKMKL